MFRHNMSPFSLSELDIAQISVEEEMPWKETVLTKFLYQTNQNKGILEYFSGSGENFFSFITGKTNLYIGFEPNKRNTATFQKKLNRGEHSCANVVLLDDINEEEIPFPGTGIGKVMISRGQFHFLSPKEQRKLLLRAIEVGEEVLVDAILGKRTRGEWRTIYTKKDSDVACTVAPLLFYEEIAKNKGKTLYIQTNPNSLDEHMYEHVFILFK